MQHTIPSVLTFSGVGLHSGRVTRAEVHPAPADHGIVFIRRDVTDKDNRVPALWHNVRLERAVLCTWLENADGVCVQTIEHLMSALSACGIDNATVYLEGAELPILDGSATPFITALRAVGRTAQTTPRRHIKILKPVRVGDGDRYAALQPDADATTLTLDYSVEYTGLGAQSFRFTMDSAQHYADAVASSRTFTLKSVVAQLHAQGLALGGSLDNAVVIDDATGQPMPGQQLRYADEAVRHKLLDAIGDLALAGCPIWGRFECSKGGHALTNQLLRALFADETAFTYGATYAGVALPKTPVPASGSTPLRPVSTAAASPVSAE